MGCRRRRPSAPGLRSRWRHPSSQKRLPPPSTSSAEVLMLHHPHHRCLHHRSCVSWLVLLWPWLYLHPPLLLAPLHLRMKKHPRPPSTSWLRLSLAPHLLLEPPRPSAPPQCPQPPPFSSSWASLWTRHSTPQQLPQPPPLSCSSSF